MTSPSQSVAARARVRRVSAHYLRIYGLLCGHRWPWDYAGKTCGGELWIEDWHPKGVRGEFRYEVHCRRCQTCDPNGHARQDQLIPSALDFFHAYPTPTPHPPHA